MIVDDMHWEDLASMEPSEVVSRSQAQWDPKRGFGIPFLGHVYWVNPSVRAVRPLLQDRPLEPHLPLVLVIYLLRVQDLPLKGSMVTQRELPGGAFFFRHLHKLPTQELEEAFGNRPQAFLQAGEALGGRIVGSSPHLFELRPLPRILVAFRIWPEDEEFPAQCVITFDESIHLHLPLDAIWALTQVLAQRLIAIDKDSDPGE